MPSLRLGTRGSPLARWQADWVAARLGELGITVELIPITTHGDRTQGEQQAIATFGGQGVFTKEIQQALLEERIDLAVHSLKDLPTEPVPSLCLAAVPARGPTNDVLLSHDGRALADLPQGALIGTGSVRRQAQLLHVRPDLRMAEIRGNVDTRLRKLDEGQFEAIVLAEAGLRRLELHQRVQQILPTTVMLPAVGQGALGLETRTDDSVTRSLLEPLNDPGTQAAVTAERALLAALRGGCLAPVGALATVANDRATLSLHAVVLSPDGSKRLSASATGVTTSADVLGRSAAEELLRQGAAELIAAARM